MGYIKEPEGIDFFVDSKPLTEKDRQEISDIIAYYKLTGRKKKISSNKKALVAKSKSVKERN